MGLVGSNGPIGGIEERTAAEYGPPHTSASGDQVEDSLPKLRRIAPSAHAVLLVGTAACQSSNPTPRNPGRTTGSSTSHSNPINGASTFRPLAALVIS